MDSTFKMQDYTVAIGGFDFGERCKNRLEKYYCDSINNHVQEVNVQVYLAGLHLAFQSLQS